jgi:hypothetical protein
LIFKAKFISSSSSKVGITFISLFSISLNVVTKSYSRSLLLTSDPGDVASIISLIRVMFYETISKSYLNFAILDERGLELWPTEWFILVCYGYEMD